MANVHVSRIINGVKYEQNLCSECAGLEAGDIFSGLGEMFSGLREMSMMGAVLPGYTGTPEQQEGNGMDFEALGLKLPEIERAEPVEAKESIPLLKKRLDMAVKNEEFEKAAELRDRIYFLEKRETGKGDE